MKLETRINVLKSLGIRLQQVSQEVNPDAGELTGEWSSFLAAVRSANPWFTRAAVHLSLKAWAEALTGAEIDRWASAYQLPAAPESPKKIGVINAGNIPFVGLHDLLAVYLSGHQYFGKNASDDPLLLPWIAGLMKEADPATSEVIAFADELTGMDAVIATGSDNSARYFEYYFGKQPHIIRKNRNGVAVLTGNETSSELNALGSDIFSYFGMGCRNVAKLYVPADYDFTRFFESMFVFQDAMGHHKYMNNFEYHQAVYLLKQLPFLQNNFMILIEDERIASPLAVVHYQRYADSSALVNSLKADAEKLPCVVTGSEAAELPGLRESGLPLVTFGQTQFPSLTDYADGVDTVRFLTGL